ncbi:unnamed protein product [Strongylus vulgaris]|uniref:Uncharacterized protein n=1 Tax=Strongylus vulgaris TaxID=40348 RepID=A0A3P7KKJ3_STRVU|nr:unnamed protein product [Strongylus vulgaris]
MELQVGRSTQIKHDYCTTDLAESRRGVEETKQQQLHVLMSTFTACFQHNNEVNRNRAINERVNWLENVANRRLAELADGNIGQERSA